jgi:hypothetical protein
MHLFKHVLLQSKIVQYLNVCVMYLIQIKKNISHCFSLNIGFLLMIVFL